MCHMQVLKLQNNKIGDVGVAALANACATGALAQCQMLFLHRNQIGDKGLVSLSGALATGAMAQLEVSWLPTALISCLEPWHTHSPGLTDSFGVPYVPYAVALPL